MRRTGVTENGVAVALELAKERFGSTLTINGTAEFKKLVIEAAAKNGLDVYSTDKAMNQGLADRRAELEIEQEGQGVAQSAAVDLKVVQSEQTRAAQSAAFATVIVPVAPPKMANRSFIQGELIDHGAATYLHNEELRNKPLSYFVKLQTDAGMREVWGMALADVMGGDPAPYQIGDQIRLRDLGSVSVNVPEIQEDGSVIQIEMRRREWAGERVTPTKAVGLLNLLP